jgi:hypothetical protein
VKFRVSAMLGFKSFRHARQVLTGLELIQKLKKGQYGVPFSFGITSREMAAGSRCVCATEPNKTAIQCLIGVLTRLSVKNRYKIPASWRRTKLDAFNLHLSARPSGKRHTSAMKFASKGTHCPFSRRGQHQGHVQIDHRVRRQRFQELLASR